MFEDVIKELLEESCASIKYRIRRDILNKKVSFEDYSEEIMSDERVKYVLSWQNEDGFFGEVFHGGYVPYEKRKYCSTGCETAFYFLSEIGLTNENKYIKSGLQRLLKEDWNKGKGNWNLFKPEVGLYGDDRLRALSFAKFGIEDYDFIHNEIEESIDLLDRLGNVDCINEIYFQLKKHKVFQLNKSLPEIYHLRLLAYTYSWRNELNYQKVINGIKKLIQLAPIPQIYVKYKSQIIAPAKIYPSNLNLDIEKMDFNSSMGYEWFHTFELFARMGVVKEIPELLLQAEKLIKILKQGNGFFTSKVTYKRYKRFGIYSGLALENNWRGKKGVYDLTFRSLLILKYADMLSLRM